MLHAISYFQVKGLNVRGLTGASWDFSYWLLSWWSSTHHRSLPIKSECSSQTSNGDPASMIQTRPKDSELLHRYNVAYTSAMQLHVGPACHIPRNNFPVGTCIFSIDLQGQIIQVSQQFCTIYIENV